MGFYDALHPMPS